MANPHSASPRVLLYFPVLEEPVTCGMNCNEQGLEACIIGHSSIKIVSLLVSLQVRLPVPAPVSWNLLHVHLPESPGWPFLSWVYSCLSNLPGPQELGNILLLCSLVSSLCWIFSVFSWKQCVLVEAIHWGNNFNPPFSLFLPCDQESQSLWKSKIQGEQTKLKMLTAVPEVKMPFSQSCYFQLGLEYRGLLCPSQWFLYASMTLQQKDFGKLKK